MLSVCLSEEEHNILVLEVIPVLPLVFQKTPKHMELPASVHMDTLQKRQRKKKRKRQREEGETGASTALIHSPQLPQAPVPVDLDTPQKKKRKRQREEGETGASTALIHSPQLPRAPVPVDLDTPQKKKRGKTREEAETGADTALIHSPQLPEAPVPVDLDTPQKKKIGKTREAGETSADPTPDTHPELPESPLPVDLDTPQKKKRRKAGEAGEFCAATAVIHSPQLPEAPVPVDLDTPWEKEEKKKRKKKKMTAREEEGRETSPAPEQTDTRPVLLHTAPNPNLDPDPDPKLRRRKRRRGREEAGGERGSMLVKTERGEGEEGGETAKAKEKRKKEKRRNEARGEGGLTMVAVETSETRKRKKKHKSIVTVTTDNNTTHTTEAETTITGGDEERRGEVLEQSQPVATQAASQDGVTVTGGKKKRRRKIPKENGKKEGRRRTRRTGVDRVRQHGEEESQALRELQEFFPNLLSKAEDIIQKMIRYDLHRFKEFRQQGIELRSGRHSAQENQRIRENVVDFLALTGISSPSHLFYPQRYKEQEAEIKKLRARHRFLERIADGVARPCNIVYNRARKMFDEANHRGRFSEDELHSLKKLQTLHGNDWRTISQKMDRSVFSLEKRFNHIARNNGPWKSEEVGRLMKALQAHLESQVAAGEGGSGAGGPWLYRQQLCVNLPWREVSHQVQTRTWTQCRVKWFNILKTKMVVGQPAVLSGGLKTVQAKIDLINTLYSMKAEDPADIDWEEVALAIGRVSPFDVQKVFHRLKVSRVPMWSTSPYCDIIDFLREKEVPRMEEVLKNIRRAGQLDEEQQETRGEEQEKYLLSDIFSQQEEFSEVDNAQLTAGQSQNGLME